MEETTMAMKVITIFVPDPYLRSFESLIKLGLFNSRSQIAREALKEFIDKENIFMQDLEPEQFEKLKKEQVKKP
jgi:Arc/MetJ-type ribon-helix-helix transcriptional regulator